MGQSQIPNPKSALRRAQGGLRLSKAEIRPSTGSGRPEALEGRNRPAFTLVEILVVVIIITILLTIVVGAMVYAKSNAKKQNTIATMKVVMNAIDAFYEENQFYPGGALLLTSNYRYSDGLHGDLFDITYEERAGKPPSHNCVYESESIGQEKLTDLDQEVFKVVPVPRPGENDRAVPAFSDGYGNVMLYASDAGLGGTPVLLSAGNDEKFGPGIIYFFNGGWQQDSDDDADSEDNIRSDKVQ